MAKTTQKYFHENFDGAETTNISPPSTVGLATTWQWTDFKYNLANYQIGTILYCEVAMNKAVNVTG